MEDLYSLLQKGRGGALTMGGPRTCCSFGIRGIHFSFYNYLRIGEYSDTTPDAWPFSRLWGEGDVESKQVGKVSL